MVRGFIKLSLALAALFLLGAAQARADTTINFDNVSDGTVINTAYAGVTFACFGSACPSGNVYARSFGSNALSLPNVVSTLASGFPYQQDSVDGAIEVIFAAPQTSASIDAFLTTAPEGLGSTGYGYLQAYDSSLHMLTQTNDTTLDAWTTLSVSGDGISYLLIGDVGGGQNYISLFDNLTYSDGGGTSTNVPEPGTLVLSALGLAAFGLKRLLS